MTTFVGPNGVLCSYGSVYLLSRRFLFGFFESLRTSKVELDFLMNRARSVTVPLGNNAGLSKAEKLSLSRFLETIKVGRVGIEPTVATS